MTSQMYRNIDLRKIGLTKMLARGTPMELVALKTGVGTYDPSKDPDCDLYVPLPEYGFGLVQKKQPAKAKPIRPQDLAPMKGEHIPSQVFEAFNEQIAKDWDGREACFLQKTVLELLIQKFERDKVEITPDEIFRKHFLDVEPVYEGQGWRVVYDKPSIGDNYAATFRFIKR